MAKKKQEKKKLASCIIGQAQVVFGGAVLVKMGSVQGNEDAVAVGLSELKHPCPHAGMEPENDETFGVQVMLVFPDLPTLTNFRGILDEVETALKSRMKDEMEALDQIDPHHLVHQHQDAEQQQWMVDSEGLYGCRPMRIVGAVDADGYVSAEMQDGCTLQPRLDTLRRWTIRDAFNGDVLVCRYPKDHEGPRESIFIFREVADRNYVSHAVEYHCRLYDGEFQLAGQGYMGALEKASDSDSYRPATAAETKQMWEAVQQAGYEWDEESGKLRGMF